MLALDADTPTLAGSMLLLERTVDISVVPAALDQAIRAALEAFPVDRPPESFSRVAESFYYKVRQKWAGAAPADSIGRPWLEREIRKPRG